MCRCVCVHECSYVCVYTHCDQGLDTSCLLVFSNKKIMMNKIHACLYDVYIYIVYQNTSHGPHSRITRIMFLYCCVFHNNTNTVLARLRKCIDDHFTTRKMYSGYVPAINQIITSIIIITRICNSAACNTHY